MEKRGPSELRIETTAYSVVALVTAAVLFVRMGGLQHIGGSIVVGSLLMGAFFGLFAYWLLKLAVAAVIAITTEIVPSFIDHVRPGRRA